MDFPNISRYATVPTVKRIPLTEQLKIGQEFFRELRQRHPMARIIFIEGNHEFRFRSYSIRLAPELYDYLNLARDLHLKEYRIEFVGTHEEAAKWKDTYIDIEGMKIGHFDRVCKGSGSTVRNLMRDKGNVNIAQSHIHRGGIIYYTNIDDEVTWGMEVPCLAKSPTYSSVNDWQRGLGFIEKNDYGEWRPRVICF